MHCNDGIANSYRTATLAWKGADAIGYLGLMLINFRNFVLASEAVLSQYDFLSIFIFWIERLKISLENMIMLGMVIRVFTGKAVYL